MRGQVRAATPLTVGGRRRQAERAVQTWPTPGVRPPAGVRQTGGPTRARPALRAGRGPFVTAVRHINGGPIRVLYRLPVGRQLFRQRRGPAERNRRVHARFRMPVQGHSTVRLPVAVAHQLCAIR